MIWSNAIKNRRARSPIKGSMIAPTVRMQCKEDLDDTATKDKAWWRWTHLIDGSTLCRTLPIDDLSEGSLALSEPLVL